MAGADGHCSDLRKPEGLPGGGRCGGGEAAGALPPRQDAGRVPFEGGSRVSGVRLIITPG